MTQKQKTFAAVLLALVILLIDQFSKIYIKTNFCLGESVEVFSWFHIRFIENNGMAFGMEIFSKLFLTLFRVVAVFFLGYYLWRVIKKELSLGYTLCVSALVAGALGNIIDCVFYGVCFSESTFYSVAEAFPEGGGYAPYFYGKVVDMLHFPLIDCILPSWFPIWGGERFTFFDPVFNVADSAICVSIFYVLLFERKSLNIEFKDDEEEKDKVGEEEKNNQKNDA